MSVVTILWSMMASACLTLAAIYLLVWYHDRVSRAHLWFALTAISAAGFAFCELWMMRAATPAELGLAIRWAQLPLFFWLVSIVWFVRAVLNAGRQWLAWTITGLRAVYLVPTFVLGANPNFLEMSNLRQIQILGESITVADGVPNPLTIVGQAATVLILVFVGDAARVAWRRGERRRALMIGGSVAFFLLASLVSSSLVIWGDVQAPIVFTVLNLGLVAVMGYEISHDVLRASQLVRELQTSEAGLRESEERMGLAVEVANLAIWTRDLELDTVWASERWRSLFGFSPVERLDRTAVLKRVHPDDRPGLEAAQERALAGANGGRYHLDYRLVLPGGGVRWISSHARVECDATGRPIQLRGAALDITARKQAEQETLQLREEVALVGRVSMLGQLASALAHEINQPLGAILRNAEAAELFLNHPSPDLDEIRAILTDIRKDDQRAGAVIDRMRRLLKRHSLDTRALEIGELVGEVSALVRVDAQARHVKLLVAVPRGLPLVRGDRIHLQQVLLNLLMNGMDALGDTPPGERQVRVSARLHGGDVEIAVADAGHGIPADQLTRVFEPFFTTKPTGMGMGLPISRTIVEAHGGRLWAENVAGGGAAFRFTLPVTQKDAA